MHPEKNALHSLVPPPPGPGLATPLGFPVDAQWLQEQADHLRQVALQMDSFLQRQLERLQRHMVVGSNWNQQEFAQVQAAFQQMKLKWEEDRQQEKQLLLDDAQRLAEAWQRLEQEQRELLKQRATFKSNPAIASSAAPASPLDLDGPLQPSRVEVKPKTSGAAAYAGEVVVGQAAGNAKNQLQFQQLRREMLEHSRQHRKR